MFSCEPDDEKITEMEPIKRMWMFYNWVADQTDDAELAKNHAYLLGSFWNPELVKKLTGESGTVHSSTDEEFEKSTEMVRQSKEESKKVKKRKKKKV
jgi:hypothetical protein